MSFTNPYSSTANDPIDSDAVSQMKSRLSTARGIHSASWS